MARTPALSPSALRATAATDATVLEHQLLRVPVDALTHTCRSNQKAIVAEANDIAKAIEGFGANPQAARTLVDGLIGSLQRLKRKVDDARREEEKQLALCQQRIEHVARRSSELDQTGWANERLCRLIADYLLRSGYEKAAILLANSSGLEAQLDVQLFSELRKVMAALDERSVHPALAWCVSQRSRLSKMHSPLEGMLHLQMLIELVRCDRRRDAVIYARENTTHVPEQLAQELRCVMVLLALGANTSREPHAQLLSSTRWDELKRQFTKDYLSIVGAPETPPLLAALGAGMAALKTPCCSIDAHRCVDCPTCTEPIRALCSPLPLVQRSRSTLVCRLSGAIIDEDNPPMVLPNGQVYSQQALLTLSDAYGGSCFQDPRGEETVQMQDLRRAYFL